MNPTPYQVKLLVAAFHVLEDDMTYDHESKIFELTGCAVSDLYTLADTCRGIVEAQHQPKQTR